MIHFAFNLVHCLGTCLRCAIVVNYGFVTVLMPRGKGYRRAQAVKRRMAKRIDVDIEYPQACNTVCARK